MRQRLDRGAPSRSRCIVIGVRAALRAPSHIAGELGELLATPARPGSMPDAGAELSARWARRAVRGLATLPGGRWRNTCLFRSAAECLALREHGVAARVRLGARGAAQSELGEPAAIDAHAWLEVDADGIGRPGESFTPIEPSRAPTRPRADPSPGRGSGREAAGR